MKEEFSRTELIYGEDAMQRFASSRVAVFGIGGVGGYVTEALARSGIGALDLIDNDIVSISNINRQIFALHSTVGKYKVDIAEERIRDINPGCIVRTYKLFYLPETKGEIDFHVYDYVVDAIDTVTGKLTIIESAMNAKVPVISSMGTGNKTDPAKLEIRDLYETSICPLAKVMRKECRKRGIDHLKVVCSEEEPQRPFGSREDDEAEMKKNGRRSIPGSTAFVPSTAGLIIAGEVIRHLTGV